MSEIDIPTIAEARALAFLRKLAAAHDHERHVIDYVYDPRHMRRVRRALRAERIYVRFGIHERGVWVRVAGCVS